MFKGCEGRGSQLVHGRHVSPTPQHPQSHQKPNDPGVKVVGGRGWGQATKRNREGLWPKVAAHSCHGGSEQSEETSPWARFTRKLTVMLLRELLCDWGTLPTLGIIQEMLLMEK